MATGAAQTFRTSLLLLAAVDLAALGVVLWPWQEALRLPVGGTAAIDPAVCLLAYIGSLYWIGGSIQESTRKALSMGSAIGIAAGLVLAVWVVLSIRVSMTPGYLQPGVVGVAVILWGVAGLRGSREAGVAGVGALSGMWSAMTSGLMACAAILSEVIFIGPAQNSGDPWKQYQGLAIGNAATQGLVSSLHAVTAFLLLGPLAGAATGFIFAFFGKGRKI